MSRKATRMVIVLFTTLLAVLSPLAVAPLHRVSAQTNPTLIELTGTITAMAAGSITINGKLIDTSAAQIKGTLAVGTVAKVQGTLLASGRVRAREVKVEARVQRAQMEIVGTLQSWVGQTMVVDGQSYDVTGAQILRGVRVGVAVKLEFRLVSDQWRVRQVKPATPADLKGDDNGNTNDNIGDDNDNTNGNGNGNGNANMNDNHDDDENHNGNHNDNDDDHSGKGDNDNGGGDDSGKGKGGGGGKDD